MRVDCYIDRMTEKSSGNSVTITNSTVGSVAVGQGAQAEGVIRNAAAQSHWNNLMYAMQTESLRIVPEGEEFTLSSGKKSRVFCDAKKTIFRARNQQALMHVLDDLLRPMKPQVLAGVVLGGCHLASIMAVAGSHSADVIYVRKVAKDHGTKSLVEKPATTGSAVRQSVVVLEDVVTTGASVWSSIKAIEEDPTFVVVGVVALVDRRSDRASPVLTESVGDARRQVRFESVFKLEDLIPREILKKLGEE